MNKLSVIIILLILLVLYLELSQITDMLYALLVLLVAVLCAQLYIYAGKKYGQTLARIYKKTGLKKIDDFLLNYDIFSIFKKKKKR